MAKPSDPDNRYIQKKADPAKDTAQEQEEEGAQKETQEPEHARAQNTLGNEALQNQMITSGNTGGGGGGGGGGGLAMRKASTEKEDRDYGGDGDAADDLPLTLEDLVRSWNPGTHKTQDRASWLEPMPDDELPPEDPDFLAAVKSGDPVFRVQGGFTLDAQLQPSAAVVAASLLDWTRAVQRWSRNSLLHRAISRAYVPPQTFLQDADGRILLSRARAAAIGSWMLLDAPVLDGVAATPDVAFVGFSLELEGHRRHQEAVRIDPGVEGKQMPKAVEVFQRAFAHGSGAVEPRELPEPARTRMSDLLTEMIDLEDPAVYLPALIAAPDPEDEEEDDDPLGIDALLWELTGAQKDPDAPLYYAAIQAAEKLAAATARSRIHVASTGVAVAQCSRMWSSGPPVRTLLRVCEQLDAETDRNLRLLVEIARAAQRRSVPPKGLKAGLKRASRALKTAQRASMSQLADIVGGVLPGPEQVPEGLAPIDDPLDQAWLDGNPVHALPWLRSLPETPENTAVLHLTRACIGDRDPGIAAALLHAADHLESPYLAEILRICAGPLLLAAGALDAALALSTSQMELGASRRNGMVLANGTLLGVEAHRLRGEPERAEALRLDGGRLAWRIGAPGALSLLARYTTENEARPGEEPVYVEEEDADEASEGVSAG
ncbi:MAG: hypothetical protein H6737_08000 [Alphaproteobacteria bacterium]|nr:hypothetical protein [Alphaproteobacteria bacterium]